LNSPKVNFDFSNIKEPLYDAQDLNYIVSPDLKKTFDSRSVIARILDGSEFEEYKK
jgi:3-methylcrotonyl-CoA carboxylase beta subunit